MNNVAVKRTSAAKKAPRPRPAKERPHQDSADHKTGVRVRMYRVGLGDCFLLTSYLEEKPDHMLIDCGMFAGSRLDPEVAEKDLQKKIVESIKQETGGKLDVVVVTHEHMDHVSIFNSAKDVFDEIEFENVWFGWVEDPTNDLATALRKKYEKLQDALQTALASLQRLASADPDEYSALHQGVAQIAQFAGLEADGSFTGSGEPGALGAAKAVAAQPREAIDYVKGKVAKGNIQYGSPGGIWSFGGLKVYVLGPPASEQQLRIMERAGATYDKALMLGLDEALESGSEVPTPFATTWGHSVSVQDGKLNVPDAYGDIDTSAMLDRYNDPLQSWRQIDDMMLESSATLALQMDKYINNTSLVLAFELPNQDVLLFPGDAQVGNWDSWSAIKDFDSDDLIKRTVFYKVGHHGSHNATLKPALEKMTNSKLVAMIPTNEWFARKSKHWIMPAPILYQTLEKHTAGRVLRNDQGKNDVPDPVVDRKDVHWDGLDENVKADDLFIDYFVRG
jgi:beta-lactamase superfamily II metal-dependent hydrolase